jgi:hypothetical protein
MNKIYLWLLSFIIPRTRFSHFHICANRREGWIENKKNNTEIKIIMKDLNEPDRYSREEVVTMFLIVKREEQITGWKVPEDALQKFLIDRYKNRG